MSVIHIIGPFTTINGGAIQAIDLYLELGKQNQVNLWCRQLSHPEFQNYPIRSIKPYQGEFPSGGTLYICGADLKIGHWYDNSEFDRIVLIHNVCHQNVFYHAMHRLSLNGKRAIDILYASDLVKRYIGLDGKVDLPLPHPERFIIGDKKNDESYVNKNFTVGRISRDTKKKHHPNDIWLYKHLSQMGIHIKIVGGTCLEPWLVNIPNITLLPEIPFNEVPSMLASFDCFYYRVTRNWHEAFGLVIAEAIKAGLPVVAYDDGGYTEWLREQKNGFLFKNSEEAINIIKNLQSINIQSHHHSPQQHKCLGE